MDIKMNQVVRNAGIWLNRYHVLLVCILSVAHIGLSCIHTRDSGRADLEIIMSDASNDPICRSMEM